MLEGAIVRQPGTVEPLRLLTYVLLQEGRDLRTAEQSLRQLLILCPDDAEARQNLTVLVQRGLYEANVTFRGAMGNGTFRDSGTLE